MDEGCGWIIIIWIIIGLCTYLYGCNPYLGGYCARYVTENILITTSNEHIHGTVNYHNQDFQCERETGVAYETPF